MGALAMALAAGLALGALAALGQPGIDALPVGLLALVGLGYVIARRARLAHAALTGLGFGGALFAAIMLSSASWGANVPALLAACGAFAAGLPLAVCAELAATRLRPGASFVGLAAAWGLAMDAADALGVPLNWEAASLAASAPYSLAGARFIGANTLTSFVVAGAVCGGIELARAPSAERLRRVALPLGLALVLVSALGLAAWLTAPASRASLSVGIPQMNVPASYFAARQGIANASDKFDEEFAAQLRALGGVDLVALTEAYDGRFALEVPLVRARFQRYARLERQALLLTSYLVAPDGGGYNAVAGIAPSGDLIGVHKKVDLAPFGETDLTPGRDYHALPLWPDIKVGAMICQESVPPRAARELTRGGANLLVATTSDASFGSSLLVFGHLAMTAARAVESGRDVVWASGSGPSGVINRWGDFKQGAPLRTAQAARGDAELFDDVTPFHRAAWLWPLLRVLALLGLTGRFWLRDTRRVDAPGVDARKADPREDNVPRVDARKGDARKSDVGADDPASDAFVRDAPASAHPALALFALLSSVAFASLVSVGAPALVERRHGDPARAWHVVSELWNKPSPSSAEISYQRFAIAPGQSARGALAFYLDFYGPSRAAVEVDFTKSPASFDDLLRYLRDTARFPARRVALDWKRLPRAATLVRRRDGEYGVLTTNGIGVASLFSPSDATPIFLRTTELEALLEPVGILPQGAPETAAYE